MKIDFEKVGTIAQYFAENTEKLYVTKLLKLFYYLDFISYKQRGASVTNDVYFKLPYGPVPSAIKSEIDNLSDRGIVGSSYTSQLSDFIVLEAESDTKAKKVVSRNKKAVNLKLLSEVELKLISLLAKKYRTATATFLSNQTHQEGPWSLTSENAVISYELANTIDLNKVLPAF